jgi:hypothetical protein
MAKFATDEVASAKRTPAWRDLIDGDAFGNPPSAPPRPLRDACSARAPSTERKARFRLEQGYGVRVRTLFHGARYDFSNIILYDQSANRCENAKRGARA